MKRYYTCEVSFDNKTPFYFYSDAFYVEASSELEAEKLLEPLIAQEWGKIVPYPPPKLLAVIPGELVLVQ